MLNRLAARTHRTHLSTSYRHVTKLPEHLALFGVGGMQPYTSRDHLHHLRIVHRHTLEYPRPPASNLVYESSSSWNVKKIYTIFLSLLRRIVIQTALAYLRRIDFLLMKCTTRRDAAWRSGENFLPSVVEACERRRNWRVCFIRHYIMQNTQGARRRSLCHAADFIFSLHVFV